MNTLKENDKVTVFRNARTYDATVLGLEGDLFWLLVLDLNEVQRGHQINLFEHQGMKCLKASEWDHKIAEMFDTNGQFNHDVFSASPTPPENVIAQLKVRYIIGGFQAGSR